MQTIGNLLPSVLFVVQAFDGRLHHLRHLHFVPLKPNDAGRWHHHRKAAHPFLSAQSRHIFVDNSEAQAQRSPTSALLQVSYDGSRFHGWSTGNVMNNTNAATTLLNKDRSRSRNRRRNRQIYALGSLPSPGQVRSVQAVLCWNLAKIYGNIDPERVIVEGCSRTDKGVHATAMVAMIYALKTATPDSEHDLYESGRSIPGKRQPHPKNGTDATCFLSLPMNIEKLGYTLNRMLPPDVRIMQAAQLPAVTDDSTVFHPSLSSLSKTYQYKIIVAARLDPVERHFSWHVGSHMDLKSMRHAAVHCLQGRHDFVAFRGAARGTTDKHKFDQQDTVCRVFKIDIATEAALLPQWRRDEFAAKVQVTIRADRFLYKMVRFLVGALVAVGTGDLTEQDLRQMLETGERHKHFECAPAHGLVLSHVEYGDRIDWKAVNS